MKQLFHTSCKKGKSLNGSAGYQVRSVSAGVPDGRMRTLLPFATYELPLAELDRDRLPERAPVRLAIFDVPNIGRILCHGVYVGQDPTTPRDGNYFTHLVFDVPNDIDPQAVIGSWGSDFWRRADDDDALSTQLDDVADLPRSGVLCEESLRDFLQDGAHQKMFRFLLDASLALQDGGRIFLVAHSSKVAACLWGMFRCLPTPFCEGLTFSTYEKNPATSFARIVATWWGNVRARDLPQACYAGKSFGLNSFTGRETTLPQNLAYVKFLVASCAAGRFGEIDEFHAKVNARTLRGAKDVDLLYRLIHEPSSVKAEELQAATEVPQLRACVMRHPGAIAQLTCAAVTDSQFARAGFSDLLSELESDRESLGQVVRAATERARQAARAGEREVLRGLFEHLLPVLPKKPREKIAGETLNGFDAPTTLPAEVYDFLLPYALRWYRERHAEERIGLWLAVSADKVTFVLERDLDAAFKVRACMAAVGDRPGNASKLAAVLCGYPELVIPVMKEFVQEPKLGEQCAATLFGKILSGDASEDLARELLEHGGELPQVVFASCFQESLNAGLITPRMVAAPQGPIPRLTEEQYLLVCQRLVEGTPVHVLIEDRSVARFLERSRDCRNVSRELRSTIDAISLIRQFMNAYDTVPRSIPPLADAIAEHIPEGGQRATLELVSRRTSERLVLEPSVESAWGQLEIFLSEVGEISDVSALFDFLLAHAEAQPGFWKGVPVLHAFLACAFGVSCAGRRVPWDDRLVDNGVAFARRMARHSRRGTFRAVYRETKKWRNRQGWQQFEAWRAVARDVEPQSILGRVGSAAGAIAGFFARPSSAGDGGCGQQADPDGRSGSPPPRGGQPTAAEEDIDGADVVIIDDVPGGSVTRAVHLVLNALVVAVVLIVVWQLLYGKLPLLRWLLEWLFS